MIFRKLRKYLTLNWLPRIDSNHDKVIQRRLTRKLIEARWIVPVHNGSGEILFDAEKVHRALGTRLLREGYTLLPRALFPPAERKEERKDAPSLEEIVLDEAELARLLK